MNIAKTAGTIGRVVGALAAIVAVGAATLMLVPAVLGLDRYVITGGSMSGTFERGALVFEEQVPVADLRVGDLITYLPPTDSGISELVTHRVIAITQSPDATGTRVLRTRGDANDDADPWSFTLADSVQPRVVGWVPAVGWVFIALSQPGIRMLTIGVPAAAIALLFLRDLLRGLRGARAEADAVADDSAADDPLTDAADDPKADAAAPDSAPDAATTPVLVSA